MSLTAIDPVLHFNTSKTTTVEPIFRIINHHEFNTLPTSVFRTYYYSIFIFTKGSSVFKVGSRQYNINSGDVAMVGPGLPFQWSKQNDLEFDAIVFNETTFGKAFDMSFYYMLNFFCPDAYNVIQITDKHQLKILKLLETLKLFKSNNIAVPGLLHTLLMVLQEQYNKQHSNFEIVNNSKENLVSSFRLLLAKHFTQQKSVAFYASQLNITPQYLSKILLAQTGWNTKKWIEHHLSVEAKSLLNYSKFSIKEVAFQLGYDDVSHFTKAFKKWTQVTPGEFISMG